MSARKPRSSSDISQVHSLTHPWVGSSSTNIKAFLLFPTKGDRFQVLLGESFPTRNAALHVKCKTDTSASRVGWLRLVQLLSLCGRPEGIGAKWSEDSSEKGLLVPWHPPCSQVPTPTLLPLCGSLGVPSGWWSEKLLPNKAGPWWWHFLRLFKIFVYIFVECPCAVLEKSWTLFPYKSAHSYFPCIKMTYLFTAPNLWGFSAQP